MAALGVDRTRSAASTRSGGGAPSAAGAASLLGLGLMLGALLSLAWALTGQLVWEIAGFGVGACVVGLIARARALATPVA